MNPATRRDFSKLGAATLGAQFVPELNAQAAGRRIGYAVIGLGRIAGHFMPSVRASSHAQITGLVSGHRDKADKIAGEYGVASGSIYSYDNFDSIADNKSI